MFVCLIAMSFVSACGRSVQTSKNTITDRDFWKMERLTKDNKAQAGSIIGIVIVVVVLMLSALILAPLQNQAEGRVADLNNTEASATFKDITAASWGSLSTASIIPYVIVFVVILGLIAGLGARRD